MTLPVASMASGWPVPPGADPSTPSGSARGADCVEQASEDRDADLKGNPGIGQSKGPTGHDVEGDVENETRTDGGIDPNHRGRDHA